MRPIDFFDTAAEAHEGETAVVDGDVRLTFRELRTLSERVAGLFRAEHRQTLTVAIVSPNDYRVLACMLGAMRAGAQLVTVHARDSASKKLELLSQVRPDWILYHGTSEGDMALVRADLDTMASWGCLDRPALGDPSLEILLQSAASCPPDWSDVYGSQDHPVYIRQTSGTTGTPKLVAVDGGAFTLSVAVMRQKLECRDGTPPVALVAAPLSHAAGVHAFCMLTLGATLVLMRDFDAREVLDSFPRHGVTHLWLPPTAMYLLLTCPNIRSIDCSSIRSLVLGASAAAPQKLREAVEVFGPCVSLNYAQIESGFLTWLDADVLAAAAAGDHPERLRSSGTSMFVSRFAIMSDEGQLLGKHETGEIVVRGRSVKPYVDPVATAEAQRFGWHHTGDLGYLDEHGYLYVVGRKKDNIITGGFKVSAAEVEQVIMELPEIHECAVVGVPHAVRGEAVTAVVTIRPGLTLTPSSILEHCRARLGRVKAPLKVAQWSELPKSSPGKVDKRAIRELLENAKAESVY